MSSILKNLSSNNKLNFTGSKKLRLGIVVSEWNDEITSSLLAGTIKTLIENGVPEKNILIKRVPGSFELPRGAQIFCQQGLDAVICLGCVIQGETRHFDFICQAVAWGIMKLNLKYEIPVIFGVLTPENLNQAKARAGGKHGNKGVEAAVTALKMIAMEKMPG